MSEELATVLNNDGIAVAATDTLYGVLGSARSEEVVERIYKIKGRDEVKPFIVLVPSIEVLKEFGVELSQGDTDTLDAFWPGALTVILPVAEKDRERLSYLHRGTDELAFRLPAKEPLLELLQETGPLVAPSANLQGMEPAHTIEEAQAYFGNAVDWYEDGGEVTGLPSTIVRMHDGEMTVVRQGSVSVV
jgi:L-threonylcarbamoyladenylate synthase